MKYFIISAFILLFSPSIAQQNADWVNYTHLERIHSIHEAGDSVLICHWGGVTVYDTLTGTSYVLNKANSGLPHNSVTSYATTEEGIQYFGTRNGIVKLENGIWTKVIGPSGSNIYDIIVDSLNRVWVASYGSGISMYDGNSWTNYSPYNSQLPSAKTVDLEEGANGVIWISTDGGGAARFSSSDNTWQVFDQANGTLPTNYITTVQYQTDTSVFIVPYSSYGLYKYNGSTFTVINSGNSDLYYNHIYGLEIDKQGKLIISMGSKFQVYDGSTWILYTPENLLSTEVVRAICASQSGKIYFGNTVLIIKDSEHWENVFVSNTDLPHGDVTAILHTSQNHHYFGTPWGIAVFDGTSWSQIHAPDLPSNTINALAEDKHGNIWIGTSKGVVKYDGVNFTVYDINNSDLPDNNVYALAVQDETIWIGTYWGLAKLTGSEWTVYLSSTSQLPYHSVKHILVTDQGTVWVGCSWNASNNVDGGLVRIEGDVWTVYLKSNSGLPYNGITSLKIDGNNNLWVGTSNPYGQAVDYGGLAKFDGTNWEVFDKNNAPFRSNRIGDVEYLPSVNQIWVSVYYEGIYTYDLTRGEWDSFTTYNSPLSSGRVLQLVIDPQENVWAGYEEGQGISKIKLEALVTALPGSNAESKEMRVSNPINSSTIKIFTTGAEKGPNYDFELYTVEGKLLKRFSQSEITWSGDVILLPIDNTLLKEDLLFLKAQSSSGFKTFKLVTKRP